MVSLEEDYQEEGNCTSRRNVGISCEQDNQIYGFLLCPAFPNSVAAPKQRACQNALVFYHYWALGNAQTMDYNVTLNLVTVASYH